MRSSILKIASVIGGLLSVSVALAGLPLPDAVIVGELRINGQLIPATRGDVSVIARRVVGGIASDLVSRYTMGDRGAVGDKFAVKVRMESLVNGSQAAANAIRVGDTIRLLVQVAGGTEESTGVDLVIATPGPVLTRALSIGSNTCPEDINGDGMRDLTDLAFVLTNFGTPSGATHAMGDVDGDADVDLADLAFLLTVFGSPCAP